MDGLHDLELREGGERLLKLHFTFNGGGRRFESEREAGRDERNEKKRAASRYINLLQNFSAALAAASNLLAAASSAANRGISPLCHPPAAGGVPLAAGEWHSSKGRTFLSSNMLRLSFVRTCFDF